MKARKRLDAITESARAKMQDEVSTLLGKPLSFSEGTSRVVSKEDYFSDLVGKYVLARLSIQGELEGEGYLLVTLKDAIRIGGTLIMLPEPELEEAITNDEYSEDAKDSYGEIANIIAGSFTSTFEEQYPKPVRFVRTSQEIVIPVKVEAESDEPCPNQDYYLLSTAMTLDGVEMGEMHFLLPAELFGLVEESDAEKPPKKEQVGRVEGEKAEGGREKVGTVKATDDSNKAAGSEDAGAATGTATQATGESESAAETADQTEGGRTDSAQPAPTVNVEKEKKRLDIILTSCCQKIAEEVSALLGVEYSLENLTATVYSKEECLDQLNGKQVMARMEIRGDDSGRESLLFCGLKDAILLGGKLIMLPDSELEQAMLDEDFSDDSRDAYGEVANIIAGVYTAVFEEQYRKSLGFVKTDLEQIIPVTIDPDNDDVFANGRYYHVTVAMAVDGTELGPLQTIFPAELFSLENYGKPVAADDGVGVVSPSTAPDGTESKAAETLSGEQASSGSATRTVEGGDQAAGNGNEVLIVTANDVEGQNIASLLENHGLSPRVLHLSDDVNSHLPGNVCLVFLVMDEIDDKGLSVAIKIRSACGNRIPMVAAGPAWTRSKVLKAVKYGADDILITPAQADDIEEKIAANLHRKAA